MYQEEDAEKIAQAITDLDPTGYRILIVLPSVKDTSKGGVLYTARHVQDEQVAACVGFVAKVGPEAYADKDKFPSGAWCKEGDWIAFKPYSGTRLKSSNAGIEVRLISDDAVEGVIASPGAYERV